MPKTFKSVQQSANKTVPSIPLSRYEVSFFDDQTIIQSPQSKIYSKFSRFSKPLHVDPIESTFEHVQGKLPKIWPSFIWVCILIAAVIGMCLLVNYLGKVWLSSFFSG